MHGFLYMHTHSTPWLIWYLNVRNIADSRENPWNILHELKNFINQTSVVLILLMKYFEPLEIVKTIIRLFIFACLFVCFFICFSLLGSVHRRQCMYTLNLLHRQYSYMNLIKVSSRQSCMVNFSPVSLHGNQCFPYYTCRCSYFQVFQITSFTILHQSLYHMFEWNFWWLCRLFSLQVLSYMHMMYSWTDVNWTQWTILQAIGRFPSEL